ncbi:DUF4328 domain-containing protein [Mycobacterium sp. 21AC1]|uniref:DUF4328 domain-containing protein n=1 Tax=[Mycobacterium] appelbergii TaxID=2939269 RepID=UPI0029390E45|nr:DUF4328 domain-containing protein [Mycobacterium sp. 21AC1]MDV3123817.1 DUF4328 domain-containing protein [Mycobacterium sp. 21AC1]
MIQVCSQCGTRWNVRERQRSWCPRCGGTLLAPSAPQQPQMQWASAPAAPATPTAPAAARTPPRLAPGYRWIAVRPGPPPFNRRKNREPGPTPRYRTMPSWGLYQHFDVDEPDQDRERRGPAPELVRVMLVIAVAALGIAAFAHVVRYALLLVNRSMLLHPLIAGAGVLFGLLASVVALGIVVITAVLLVNWLIARRAAAFAYRGQVDPRSPAELWICCLFPGVNLFVAPVFVLELATLEGRLTQLRRPIVVWWIVWVLSAVVAVWSVVTTVMVTFFSSTPQNIADNTVTTAIGYLLALSALLLAARVFSGFEQAPVAHSARRWVVVGAAPTGQDQHTESDDQPESAVPVETEGRNPAA